MSQYDDQTKVVSGSIIIQPCILPTYDSFTKLKFSGGMRPVSLGGVTPHLYCGHIPTHEQAKICNEW